MFSSIRWRLVLSFTLLTLLTVSLLGVLVISLMRSYIDQQTTAYLTANAETLARQSLFMMEPALRQDHLLQLAHTAAFLGDVQVRILDDRQQPLVDSGVPGEFDQVAWMIEEGGTAISPAAPPQFFMSVVASQTITQAVMGTPVEYIVDWGAPNALLPNPVAFDAPIMVRRSSGPWGVLLDFSSQNAAFPVDHQWEYSATLATWSEFTPALPHGSARSAQRVVAPIQATQGVIGYVEVGRAPNLALEALDAIRRALFIAAGAVSVLAIGVGLAVSRGLTAPLALLTAATDRMNQGDLSARAPVAGRDEIGVLAHRFNRMAEALEQSFAALSAERDALRRFIADASHEFRTPLTALRTFNDLLAGSAWQDETVRREFLREEQEQITRLERITHNLLKLSRLESGLVTLDLQKYLVTDLLDAILPSFKRLAQERLLTLTTSPIPDSLLIYCDREQFEIAFNNLLDNALKFTPAGGQIDVGVETTPEWVTVWVKDSGPGIEAAELPLIFERFHRGRNPSSAGSGLGLAIVKSIQEAHDGSVEVVSHKNEGSRFMLKFPVYNINS